jgi:hypothetical protein
MFTKQVFQAVPSVVPFPQVKISAQKVGVEKIPLPTIISISNLSYQ